MPSDEYIASVEEMIARNLVVEASMRFAHEKTGQYDRDMVFERIVYRALVAAMELAREQIAAPRAGTMTYAEAMQAVSDGKMVTRPGWDILQALDRYPDDSRVTRWTLDNLEGLCTGIGCLYSPTDEDQAATDWMEYRAPEIELSIDFSE